jgi:formylmethanofuran dehydrogenase subunit C
MTGGNVIVDGNIGARAGDKMRRGLILVRGTTGEAAGSRMIGGTIVAEGGLGPHAGQLMRRGTLIAPRVDRLMATFGDCGVHDLVILRLMSRGWLAELGPLAPKPFPPAVRRFAGDLAAIGKGEILLTAA